MKHSLHIILRPHNPFLYVSFSVAGVIQRGILQVIYVFICFPLTTFFFSFKGGKEEIDTFQDCIQKIMIYQTSSGAFF